MPDPSARRGYDRVKRAVDLALCVLFLPLLAALFFVCVAAIKLDTPGPAVFSQLRTGRDGRRFRMYKFRTMVRNAEQLKAELAHLNVLQAPDFKIIDDPRITRVGRLLRKTSLDELPQILNVLKGDMTFIGPRPTSFSASTYHVWHAARLEATPGITGLWQVKGRHTTSFDERLRLDVQYIRSRSPLLDLKIAALTVGAVFRRSGA
jgi:lipopolysaccharide/colanic/teichoic acid biosynthesis glycosyltransferase